MNNKFRVIFVLLSKLIRVFADVFKNIFDVLIIIIINVVMCNSLGI